MEIQQLLIREDIDRIKEKLFEEYPYVKNKVVMQLAKDEYSKYLALEESYCK